MKPADDSCHSWISQHSNADLEAFITQWDALGDEPHDHLARVARNEIRKRGAIAQITRPLPPLPAGPLAAVIKSALPTDHPAYEAPA